MRPLLLAAALLAAGVPAATASPYGRPVGPVPGYGPVCTVQCVAGSVPAEVDPKDLGALVPVCPA
jgi:hypothetical protein